jgi:uncharacterized protein involved in exopolysaccharide biosynthesis
MVTVMVSTEWASLSAAVANRLTDLVNQFNLEQRQSRTRAKREFLDRRLVEARAALSEQEARIREFYEINRQFQGAPHLRLREAELRRQVDIAQDLFLTIQRERESAQLAEVNDAALITIVDNAIPPKRAEWPRPVLAIATATFVGLVLGFVAAGLGTVVGDWARREPGSASHLRTALGEAWGGLQRFPRRRRTG